MRIKQSLGLPTRLSKRSAVLLEASDYFDVGPDLRAVWVAAHVRRITIVSVPQSQAIPPVGVAPRVPWYVYAAAILLLGWAFVLLIAWLSLERFDLLFWRAMVPVTLELAIGCGLLLRRR